MAYIKNNWVDREGTTRYFETVDNDGALIFTPDYTQVTEMGTPVNADNMNHIEEGIEDHENRITVLEEGGDASNFLNKYQITNCLLDVPQRIKYTLEDGTFTLKAGSVVIVPYGVEDLTAQYPVGSTFINENFKVADTQWYGGKFFVWAEVVEDIVSGGETTSTTTRQLFIDLSSNSGRTFASTGSGDDEYTGTSNYVLYHTSENVIKFYSKGVLSDVVFALPICVCTADGTHYIGVIDQVFNGFGYIGSTIWADKDIKGLIPNGRNEDGSLKNIEFTTPSIIISTQTGENRNFVGLGRNSETNYFLYRGVSANYKYDEEKNINIDVPNNTQWNILPIGYTTGDITSFDYKQPFRALDYNDYISGVGSTAAYIVETYVNGTSGYRIWSDGYCEQWGSIKLTQANNANATVTLLKEYKDTNGTCLVTAGQITYGGGGINYGTVGGRFTANNQIYIMCGAGGEQPTQWRTTGYLA